MTKSIHCPACGKNEFRVIESGAMTALGKCKACGYWDTMQRVGSNWIIAREIWSSQAKAEHAELLRRDKDFALAQKRLDEMTVTSLGTPIENLMRVQCTQSSHSSEIWIIHHCPFCGKHHEHSAGTGARLAHCGNNREYYLTLDPIIKEPIQKQKSPIQKIFGSLRLRFKVFQRDQYHCQICGRGAEDGVKLELGHKHAKSKGGTLNPENLVTLCFDCNRGQGTDEF